MLKCHLRDLMKDMSRRTGERITYKVITAETGISPNTLSRLAQPTLPTMIGVSVIERLCNFFRVGVGALLENCGPGPLAVEPHDE